MIIVVIGKELHSGTVYWQNVVPGSDDIDLWTTEVEDAYAFSTVMQAMAMASVLAVAEAFVMEVET